MSYPFEQERFYRGAFWGLSFASCFMLITVVSALGHQARMAALYRANAMDLCAWHARGMNGADIAGDEATKLWHNIVNGRTVCPFCGQKHDSQWISRNAWESQITALESRK